MLSFTNEGWSDYISWDDEDRKTGKKNKKTYSKYFSRRSNGGRRQAGKIKKIFRIHIHVALMKKIA